MAAHPDPNPTAESDGAFIREADATAVRRLVKLTASENERVALRACEVVLRCVREWRRAAAEPPRAKAEAKPPVPRVKVPEALVRPPKPGPAFRAVPLDKLDKLAHLFEPPSVPPVLSST